MKRKPNILVIDIGGHNLKVIDSNHRSPLKIPSGPLMTPALMVKVIKSATEGWEPTGISMGYPGPVSRHRITAEPFNLAHGWVGFDFASAFECPIRILNDAAMQALGSYEGGSMLFLGLGTGLGSALIVDKVLAPMELAHLPYRKSRTFEDYVGQRGLDRLGKSKWRRHVGVVIKMLHAALETDYVVLGGGNSELMGSKLPENVRLGKNSNAFRGGIRLWTDSAEWKTAEAPVAETTL